MQVCPKRWNWNGDVDKPTLSPSILQKCGPFPEDTKRAGEFDICHCFVRNGNIEFCGDCTHSLKGQSVTLPEMEDVLDIQVVDGLLTWKRRGV